MPQYKSQYSPEYIDSVLSKYNTYGQLAGLYGADTDIKKQVDRDSTIIDTGRGIGTLLGGGLGYLFGSEFAATSPNHDYSPGILNTALGLGGAIAGGILGNYLTFKGLSKYRGTDDRFRLRHMRKPAQLAALQGLGRFDQEEWNKHGTTIEMSRTLGPEMTRKLRDAQILDQLITASERQNRYYAV